MTNLSVIKEVKIETLPLDHSLVVSTNGSVALFCTICGGMKSVITYIGNKKDAMLQGTYTCTCKRDNAPSYGGDTHVLNTRSMDERRHLSTLYNAPSLEELRLLIPLPHISDSYSVKFYDLMSRLHRSQTVEEARSYIVQYASIREMEEPQ